MVFDDVSLDFEFNIGLEKSRIVLKQVIDKNVLIESILVACLGISQPMNKYTNNFVSEVLIIHNDDLSHDVFDLVVMVVAELYGFKDAVEILFELGRHLSLRLDDGHRQVQQIVDHLNVGIMLYLRE
jgi:hypothetical protein